MPRRTHWGLASATLLAFSAAGIAVAQPKSSKPEEAKRRIERTQTSAASAGQRIFVDPATGTIVEPTPQQLQEVEKAMAAMLDQSGEGLQEVILPDGTVMIDLEGRFHELAVATVGPDGKLSFTCANHADHIRELLSRLSSRGVTRAPQPELEVK